MGAARVTLPGAGLSGGQISASWLPRSLCPSARRGLGRGWDSPLRWGVYGHIHSAACHAWMGRGEPAGRTAGCGLAGEFTHFGHANKVRTQQRWEAPMYS